MPNAATKDRCRFMAERLISAWRAIRIGRGACRDGRASQVAANGNATTVCLDAGRRRLRGCPFCRSPGMEEIDNGRPKSCRNNDQSTSKPPQNLLIALVSQEPPERVHDSCPAMN